MLALLGIIFGFLGSFAPEILKFFNNKEDHKHELAVLTVQADMAKSEHQYQLEEIEAKADIASEQAVYQAAGVKLTGVKIIDALLALYNATVRPTIAYAYFGLYGLVKFAIYKVYIASGINQYQAIMNLWNSEDMAVFSTIISFFYGGRAMRYALGKFGTSVPQILNGITGNGNGGNKHAQPALVPVELEKRLKDATPPSDTTGY